MSFSSLKEDDDDVLETGTGIAMTDMRAENDAWLRPKENNHTNKSNGDADDNNQDFVTYLKVVLKELFFGHWMNVLLVFLPFAFISQSAKWGEGVTFVLALLALCPLAERISFVTEDVAKYTNDTLGGLLNATFGNVTEIIVCIFALKRNLVRVVQVSMLGSILSNLLLVLGTAFIVGGMKHKEQSFNAVAAVTNSGMLLLSLCGLSLPVILTSTHTGVNPGSISQSHLIVADAGKMEINTTVGTNVSHALSGNDGSAPIGLSRFIACLMLLTYVFYIVFQLVTHTYMFEGQEDDDEDPPILGLKGGIVLLGLLTVFISLLSDMIVDAIDGAATELKIPYLFIGTILIPIVGNAAEHAAAIIFAHRNKMEISLGIAVGSAVQISLFVIPLTVLLGWFMGVNMTLDFHPMETVTVLLTVVTVAFVIQDGKSTYLKGILLIAMYLCISAAFWVHVDPREVTERGGAGDRM